MPRMRPEQLSQAMRDQLAEMAQGKPGSRLGRPERGAKKPHVPVSERPRKPKVTRDDSEFVVSMKKEAGIGSDEVK